MWPVILISVYCLFVALASLAGGTLPSLIRLTHTRMQLILSAVAGLVLGVGLLHLLPHSIAETGSVDTSVGAALIGLLAMFFLIRAFHVHHHGPVDQAPATACAHDHDHAAGHCEHQEQIDIGGEECATHRHPYSWIGLCVGLTLHTLFDGIAIAASVSAEALHSETGGLMLGFGTFLAVLLHKPLDAMSITTVMAAGGWSARARQVVNVGFALTNVLGAALFYVGVRQVFPNQHAVVGLTLGFAGGVFLCIALADILPEVQFHRHDRMKLSAALVLGVALAYAIGFFESPHQHGTPAADAHDHAHSDKPPEHSHDGHSHPDAEHRDGDDDQPADDQPGDDHAGHDHGS
jgi:zinc and cadmium transporter